MVIDRTRERVRDTAAFGSPLVQFAPWRKELPLPLSLLQKESEIRKRVWDWRVHIGEIDEHN